MGYGDRSYSRRSGGGSHRRSILDVPKEKAYIDLDCQRAKVVLKPKSWKPRLDNIKFILEERRPRVVDWSANVCLESVCPPKSCHSRRRCGCGREDCDGSCRRESRHRDVKVVVCVSCGRRGCDGGCRRGSRRGYGGRDGYGRR